MADGTITFSTALDNGQLEKDLKQAGRDVDRLKEKVEKSESSRNAVEAEMERAEAAIHETEEAIDALKGKLAEVPSVAHGVEEYQAQRAEIERVGDELAAQQAKLEEQVAEIDKLGEKWQKADGAVKAAAADLDKAKQRQAELGEEYARSYSKAGASTSEALASAEARFEKFGKRVNTMMKKVFVFGTILAGLRAVKSALSDAMGQNERYVSAWENLKATVQGVANFVAGALAPVVVGFLNVVISMLMTLVRLIDSVFKTDIAGSIARARQAAKATEDQAKATRKLGKAAKDASRSIMGFDEINAMSAKTSEDAADSTGAQADATAPTWDGIDAGKIDETLGEIMLILGAALLAVGAILCFSGINIPLGITLMAIGALMIYTAYQEAWGKLPAELQAAISAALVITGIVLLVIGAVLVFSAANVPLGIGMMMAGAALLWTAVALNWDGMSDDVKGVVSFLMGVLGAALLVIGAILCFSGGGTPLGIALMAAGAATLAGLAALNWESMPEQVRQVATTVMGILGGVLLVLGFILAFSCPALVALGVGLIAAGAVLLAGVAALNWNAMPQSVKSAVSAIMAIIGGALIVLGVFLLITGAGIPLGIGLILAGVGSLVGAAAINWDFLKDKVAEIWRGIVGFWKQNIAPIFTARWWKEKFKSIANGLISILNGALTAANSFFSWLTSGISGFLGTFGVNFSFSIPQVQIPYLAQGAVIPPNREFMAVLGDQPNGRNLEAPESLIRQIVREEAGGDVAELQQAIAAALIQVLPMLQRQGSDGDVTMVLQVGHEELARAVNKGNASLARRGLVDPELAF